MNGIHELTAYSRKLQEDITGAVSRLWRRRRVTGFEDGRVRVASFDPRETGDTPVRWLRPDVRVGDSVLTVREGGEEIVVGAYRTAADVDDTYVLESELEARLDGFAPLDHQHAAGGDSMMLGPSASFSPTAGDITGTMVISANSLVPQVDRATVFGSYLHALGSRAVAIGHWITASAVSAIAIGAGANASHSRSIALGDNAATTATDQAKVRANELALERSNGSGATTVVLRSPNGTWKRLRINDDNTITVTNA